ncbi:uncharacterized protein [Nyctibius grandis]|uniref:uncharacterized protein n=1 Tax=Nyctibius grandis TaxID=48427 RepID=UPI0035BC5A7D
MEVNLENILSRDWSSRCREDRESSSIRRRRSRGFERRQRGLYFTSKPSTAEKKIIPAAGKAEAQGATIQVLYIPFWSLHRF